MHCGHIQMEIIHKLRQMSQHLHRNPTIPWFPLLQVHQMTIGRLGPEHATLLLSRSRGKLLINPSRKRLGGDIIKVSSLKLYVVSVGICGWRNLLSISLPTWNLSQVTKLTNLTKSQSQYHTLNSLPLSQQR